MVRAEFRNSRKCVQNSRNQRSINSISSWDQDTLLENMLDKVPTNLTSEDYGLDRVSRTRFASIFVSESIKILVI